MSFISLHTDQPAFLLVEHRILSAQRDVRKRDAEVYSEGFNHLERPVAFERHGGGWRIHCSD